MRKTPPSKLVLWIQLARLPFISASVIPVLIGMLLAKLSGNTVSWELFPFILAGAILFHLGTNIINEYFDLKRGVDRRDTYGGSRVLVDGLLPPNHALWGGLGCFATGFAIGLILVAARGMPMFILGVVGLLGGYFYTGWPIGFKYLALGNFGVFILMGVLLVAGPYIALTGTYAHHVFWASVPVALLVTAILYANNLRDIKDDRAAGIRTIEGVLGFKNARLGYYVLITSVYVTTAGLMIMNVLPFWALLTFFSLPIAARNMRVLAEAKTGAAHEIAQLDTMTAQLHLSYGLLYIIALILQIAVK